MPRDGPDSPQRRGVRPSNRHCRFSLRQFIQGEQDDRPWGDSQRKPGGSESRPYRFPD